MADEQVRVFFVEQIVVEDQEIGRQRRGRGRCRGASRCRRGFLPLFLRFESNFRPLERGVYGRLE